MSDSDRWVRWWNVGPHLLRPAVTMGLAGGLPAAAALALTWTQHAGPCGSPLALMLCLVFCAGALVALAGLVLLLFAAFAVAAGRLQYAALARRQLGGKQTLRSGPYR